MRVTNTTIYDSIAFNLSNAVKEMNTANSIVSSGKKILKLSDDPIGLSNSLNIKSTIAGFEQLEKNINMGKSWLNDSENSMMLAQNLISDTRALAVQMATATTGEAERQAASITVQHTLEEIAALGNTKVNGRYIFSGLKTDTAAFDQDGTYQGDGHPLTIKSGRDNAIEIGSDGSEAFGNIFTTLSDFKTALENNDIQGVQTAMENLETDFDHISSKISEIGSKMVRLETRTNILQDLKMSSSERLSKIEDADLTQAIIDMKEKELAYQAALSSSSKVMQMTLMDYV